MKANIPLQYACLHSHSTHSDGIYSPEELVRLAKDEGYSALSITDHDTYSAHIEADEAARKYGIEYLPGIEFSTYANSGENVHITAFGIDKDYPEMAEYLRLLSARETNETEQLFHRARELGLIEGIEWEDVLEFNTGITWLCNEQVFRAMKARGLATDIDYPNFFKECFGVHRNEVKHIIEFMATEELISLVHRAGGIAIHAHPHKQFHLIPSFLEVGLDGIEVWHAELPIEERRRSLEIAREHNLYVSGGQDHEGLLGGQYRRYANPEETRYFFPPRTLGTMQMFYEEIRDRRKNPERGAMLDELLLDESIWQAVK